MPFDLFEKQYEPVSTAETGHKNCLSSRYMVDMAQNIGNAKMWVQAPILINELFPANVCTSVDNDADEQIIRMFTFRYIPPEYRYAYVEYGGAHNTGTGSTLWRLYVTDIAYSGPRTIDQDARDSMGPKMTYFSLGSLSSNSHSQIGAPLLPMLTSDVTRAMFILTAENNTAAVNNYSYLSNFTLSMFGFAT